MNLTRKEREELNSLSKDVFGTSSRWVKLVEKGHEELLTEKVNETVPAEKEGEEPTVREVDVPVLNNGAKQYSVKRFTIESIREFMVKQKKQLLMIQEQIKAAQERQMAKKLEEEAKNQVEEQAKALHRNLSGSAT